MDVTGQESVSMDTRVPIHPPLPAKGKYIRVVNILPGKGTDAAGIFLEFVSEPVYIATDEPSHCYEALSYVWGEENHKVNINFKQQNDTTDFGFSPFAVTQNLSEALLHLRHEDVPRSIWIDAICINQEDRTEKNHQVFMMGEVYKRASKVIVWLGPYTSPADSTSGSNLAMKVIEKTGRDIRHDWDKGFSVLAGDETYAYAPKATWHKSVTTDEQPMLYSQDESWAICELIGRPWFHRLWIRQEIALAVDHQRDAVVQCGNACVSWKAFSCTVAYMKRNWWRTYYRWYWTGEFDKLAFVVDLCRTTRQGYDLPSLHGVTKGAGCKDPRDKVYGVMNICQDLYDLDVVPDYTCSVGDLYKEVVLKYLSTFRSLDIFAASHFVEHHNDKDLPSWVPDWASYDNRNDIPTTWPRFSNYFALQDLPQGNEGLTISGVSIGTIRNVWPLYQGGAHIQYSGSMIDIWRDGIKAMHIQDQLTQADEAKLVEAFCRTLYFGNEASDLDLNDTKIELEQEDCNGFNLRGTLAEETAIRSMHRRFFVTDNGRMGIGPNTIQPGDKVAAFLGSAMPFVITLCRKPWLEVQPDQRYYRLRGGCYVDGAMTLEPFLGPLPDRLKTFWKDGLLYLEDSKTPGHGIKDHRLERLASLEGNREWLQRGQPKPLISTTPEQWQSLGVDVEKFILL